ncbi:hypothetical protein ZEAMMB73_Zm00001d035910 [Zea mays]|uniref:Uncharacterized protein n=1 Tax=Zea mays TaxID=4577 RepID=A0A1D6LJJ7_MAIZE|nr:hypothetical protein ZEAMMB73_Zm00001d035910 [Zea mays]
MADPLLHALGAPGEGCPSSPRQQQPPANPSAPRPYHGCRPPLPFFLHRREPLLPLSGALAAGRVELPWTPRNSSSKPPSSLFVVVPAGCSTKCAASRALQQPSRSISTPLVACRRSRARCAAPSATPSKPVLVVDAALRALPVR